jgi:hypothetical protein
MRAAPDALALAAAEPVDADNAVDADKQLDSPAVAADSHLSSAILALVVGAGLTVAAKIGAPALLGAIAVVQAALVVSWVFGTGLPGRLGALVCGVLAAAGADAVVARWPHGQLGVLLAVVGVAVPAMFAHQLTRGVVRTRVVESLSDIALLVVAVVALAALVQLRHQTDGDKMTSAVILASTGALVVGHLVDMVWAAPRFDPEVSRGLLAVLAAVLAGAALAYLRMRNTAEFTAGRAAFVGAAVAAIVSLFAVGTGFVEQTSSVPDGPASRLRPAFVVLIPIGLLAPLAYLICLAIRG